MKRILVLGAGLVTRPLVRYLLEQPDFQVKVASRTLEKAQKLINNHPKGKAQRLDVTDTSALKELISQADLVISLLPYVHHVTVAKLCIGYKKQMLTTSYVSEAMQQLDKPAQKAGILILNETGVDPGLDHMSAMKIIHQVQKAGGSIKSFISYCGGLPAPEANTNPFGYKFSWSPRGVVLAGKNPAYYLRDKQKVTIPGEELFANYSTINIEGLGDFEFYPNRDSFPYIKTYGIDSTETILRATLRNLGWCDAWKKMVDLGLLDEQPRNDLKGLSYQGLISKLIKANPGDNTRKKLAEHLKIDMDSEIMKRLEWLGWLSKEPLPIEQGSTIDILAARLLEKLRYQPGERDMIILRHDFIAQYPSDRKEKITSTLIDFGKPKGDTAMSRTVGLPAAINAKLMLQGKINLTGVHIPVEPIIYEPVLKELSELGISFKETKEVLKS